jgi:capsular polysaccharide biosynthesis protein
VGNATSVSYYLGVLRRRAWIIALLALLAGGTALAVSLRAEPVYRASMKIVVGQGGGVFQPAFGNSVQPFTQTMTSLLQSNVVAEAAVRESRLQEDPTVLLDDLDVTSAPDSSVLVVTYDNPDRARAVLVLQAVGSAFTRLVQERLGAVEGAAGTQPVTATVFDPPHGLEGRVSPQPVRDTVLATLLGLALGVIAALGLEALDDRLRSRRQAEGWFGAPMFGAIPRRFTRLAPHAAIAALAGPQRSRQGALAMDLLTTNLQRATAGSAHPVIAVTAARQDADKTLTTAAIAAGLARAGRDVVVIDADLGGGELASVFGVHEATGLREVVLGTVEPADALTPVTLTAPADMQPVEMPRTVLRVLPPGRADRAPRITTERFAGIVAAIGPTCDVIVVELPPALTSADWLAMLPAIDHVVIVARQGATRRGDAEAVHDLMQGMPPRAVSVVVTDSEARPRLGAGRPPYDGVTPADVISAGPPRT